MLPVVATALWAVLAEKTQRFVNRPQAGGYICEFALVPAFSLGRHRSFWIFRIADSASLAVMRFVEGSQILALPMARFRL